MKVQIKRGTITNENGDTIAEWQNQTIPDNEFEAWKRSYIGEWRPIEEKKAEVKEPSFAKFKGEKQ